MPQVCCEPGLVLLLSYNVAAVLVALVCSRGLVLLSLRVYVTRTPIRIHSYICVCVYLWRRVKGSHILSQWGYPDSYPAVMAHSCT